MNRTLKRVLIIFFVLEMICVSLPLILKHYMPLSDTVYGLITGTAIGLLIVFLVAIVKLNKQKEIVSR